MSRQIQTQSKTGQKPSSADVPTGLLQRAKGPECEEEGCRKKRQILQRYSSDRSELSEVPPIVHQVLRLPGQPLDPDTRAFMEPRFGHDFSQVRVHTDPQAAESARAVNALAYSVGRDVVFGAKHYAPNTPAGDQLIAHELAHVMQQKGADVSDRPEVISSPDDGGEREAARAAEAVAAGRSFPAMWMTGPAVHRQPAPPGPAALAGLTATRVGFNNAGAPSPANCAPAAPATLGVDGPNAGANGMEMVFQINGAIPAGTEFDITRTKATGTWQRDAGAWSRLGGDPAGTNDDHHDDDECLTPVGGRLFVIDTPGMPRINPRGVHFPDGTMISATAAAAVRKHSFAEWVIARNRRLGIDWLPISKPLFHRWHSVVSVARVGDILPGIGAIPLFGHAIAENWVRVDTPSGQHNEIELGSIPTAGAVP